MLPAKTPFVVGSDPSRPLSKVISIKLPEDIIKLLSSKPTLSMSLDPVDLNNSKLLLNGSSFQLVISKETQVVDVGRTDIKRRHVDFFGALVEKIAIKQELASEKAKEIRLESEKAEKDRLARKTLTIEGQQSRNGRSKTKSVTSKHRLLQKIVRPTGRSPAKRTASVPSPANTKNPNVESHERDSAQSWSPPFNAAGSFDSLKTSPNSLQAFDSALKDSELEPVDAKPTVNSKIELQKQYDELVIEYKKKYQEYLGLESWIDRRLQIFSQLKKDLEVAEAIPSAQERVSKKIHAEASQLATDKEYKWKLHELEGLHQRLSHVRSLVESLCSKLS